MLFEALHQRGKQVCQHKAPDERAEYAEKRTYRFADVRDIAESHIEKYCTGYHAECRDSPVQILFIPSEFSFHLNVTPDRTIKNRISLIVYHILLSMPDHVN